MIDSFLQALAINKQECLFLLSSLSFVCPINDVMMCRFCRIMMCDQNGPNLIEIICWCGQEPARTEKEAWLQTFSLNFYIWRIISFNSATDRLTTF